MPVLKGISQFTSKLLWFEEGFEVGVLVCVKTFIDVLGKGSGFEEMGFLFLWFVSTDEVLMKLSAEISKFVDLGIRVYVNKDESFALEAIVETNSSAVVEERDRILGTIGPIIKNEVFTNQPSIPN